MSDQAALFRETTACPVLGSPSKRWGKESSARSNLAGTPRPMGLHFSGRKNKKVRLTFSTWGMRTMLDNKATPERQRALIAKELDCFRCSLRD